MDWEQANVGLDQEAFKAAQTASESGFSIPIWVIVVAVIVGAVLTFSAAKKSGDTGGGANSSNDNTNK